MRVVFMGTPDFSVPTLDAILEAGHEVVAVYAQPPRAAGRGQSERKSPVHAFAEHHGLAVRTPVNFKAAEDVAALRDLGADVGVVIAYGLLLPQSVLDAPRHGCFNMHASALPRWRGAAPIQRAIMAGDKETAATVMKMEAGLDTGPICLEQRLPIDDEITAGELHDRLAATGAKIMVEALARLMADGELVSTPQPELGVTYARKIDKAEAHLDFNGPAIDVHNHIRGLSPFPGAWFEVERPTEAGGKRERIKVLGSAVCDTPEIAGNSAASPGTVVAGPAITVACDPGFVRLTRLQRAGKRACTAEELVRGFDMPPGTQLG